MCPVCGYPELSEPARRAGGGGSYEIAIPAVLNSVYPTTIKDSLMSDGAEMDRRRNALAIRRSKQPKGWIRLNNSATSPTTIVKDRQAIRKRGDVGEGSGRSTR